VGPFLLLWLVTAGTPATDGPGAPTTADPAAGHLAKADAAHAFPDRFPLFPTMGNEGASGMAYLKQPWSPYGVSVDVDGRVQYDLTVSVEGLPEVTGQAYHVWLTTPRLERVVAAGVVESGGEITSTSDWHQLMVVVSREPADRVVGEGERWSGPIVLRGFSAGARITPMAQHSLFQQTPM